MIQKPLNTDIEYYFTAKKILNIHFWADIGHKILLILVKTAHVETKWSQGSAEEYII